jgi:hypothetical protein
MNFTLQFQGVLESGREQRLHFNAGGNQER